LLVGIAAGFVTVWYVASQTDIAWPWFCAIGGMVNISVSWGASLLLDGRQSEYSPYTVRGQKAKFAAQGLPEKEGNWYLVPGKIDSICYWLLGFFVLTVAFLVAFDAAIK
jgi:SSS family solute:Na+ symporter